MSKTFAYKYERDNGNLEWSRSIRTDHKSWMRVAVSLSRDSPHNFQLEGPDRRRRTYMPKQVHTDFDLAKSAGLAVDRFPETNEEADAAEDVLAKAVSALSLDEREKVTFDLFGLATDRDVAADDPGIIDQKLEELEHALEKVPASEKEAYELAKEFNMGYVTNRSFRLQFLRLLSFDVESSADMIVKHFEVKRELFGSGDVLGRKVRQSDLDPVDIQVLYSGFAQILPSRDAAGRVIHVLSTSMVKNFPKDGWEEKCEVSKQEVRCRWLLATFGSC